MIDTTAESKSWEQRPYAAAEQAPELTAASGVDVYHGDIEGEGHWRGLTIAGPDGNGDLVSLQRMICVVGGRSGTFVLRISGTFNGTDSRANWEVVPGSGTDELRDISGTGGFQSGGVHEHVLAAIVGLNETIALGGVEELHGTCDAHMGSSFSQQSVNVAGVEPHARPGTQTWGRQTAQMGKQRNHRS